MIKPKNELLNVLFKQYDSSEINLLIRAIIIFNKYLPKLANIDLL